MDLIAVQDTVEIEVAGHPAPKGSWKIVMNKKNGKPFLVPDNSKSKKWEEAIRLAAIFAMERRKPHDGPIRIEHRFIMPRTTETKTGQTRHAKGQFPAGTPDLDKLIRCIWDGLAGVVFTNDARVIESSEKERYDDQEPPGVKIKVEML